MRRNSPKWVEEGEISTKQLKIGEPEKHNLKGAEKDFKQH